MSFQQGVSGLNAASRNLEVIGNNVANASTVGAKYSRAEFADIYARTAGGAGGNVGLGVSVSTVAQQFSQGSISSTSSPLDVAINGAGFFQLADQKGAILYSRNGQFQVDRQGFVSNPQGQKLVAIPVTYEVGQIAGKASPLQLPTAGTAPKQTSSMKLEINLDSRNEFTFTGATPAVNLSDSKTYNNSTSINIFDAKGQQVSMTYFFQKSGPDSWNIYAAANGEPLNPDGGGVPQPIVQATFPRDGRVPITPSGAIKLNIPGTGTGTPFQTEPFTGVTLDFGHLTQFGAPFGPTALSQDGFPAGRMTGVSIQDDGTVMASYSSGQSSAIARIELANFRNNQGLKPVGGNAWVASFESGEPVLGTPGGGNLGLLQSNALEDSNVDLTSELVSMMVAQRIYQANAQTIKTQDSVMQTLVSLR